MDIMDRAEAWARRHPFSVRGVRTSLLAVRFLRGFDQTRVAGLAAEMSYYAVLSIFPLIGALGVSLGFLQVIVGPESVGQLEGAVIASLRAVFSPEIMSDVATPLVQGLLQQDRTGLAVGSFLITLLLASRVFRSAIDTLDVAYCVPERRGILELWGLGFLFALGAIVTATLMLSLVVVGPLLGGGRAIAARFGLGGAFELAWAVARWPTLVAIAIGFLALLYRVGPNVRNTWRHSLPGAVVGVVTLLLIAVGFRLYLETVGVSGIAARGAEETVVVAGKVMGAGLAALLWIWLSAIAILSGGVLNAELARLQHDVPQPKV